MAYKDRAAVYLRKSRSDNPAETVEATLARHKKILHEFAVSAGITITGEYEEVVSGEGLFTRPEMLRLLSDVENGMYTSVLCMEIDRLGRSSTKDSGIIIETLKDAGCCIITPSKTYDLEDDTDELTVELKTFFARQELKSIRRRLAAGERETLKAGGHCGEPPYAYKRLWIGKTPSLEIIPEQAEVVKLIYDWYVNQGLGGIKIADKLNAMGISGPDGGPFARTSVLMILKNPTYCGQIVWNRKRRIRKKKPTDKYKEVDNPPEQWIVAKGLHKPIISEEIFEKAQEIRKTRAHPPTYTGELKNPYAGLVYCKNCGMAIQRYGTWKNNKFYVRLLCPTTSCCGSIPIERFDSHLKLILQEKLNGLLMGDYTVEPQQDYESEKTALERQITTLKNQRSKLHDFLEQGVYDVDTFMMRQKELTARYAAAENALKEIEQKISDVSAVPTISQIVPSIENLLNNWDDLEAVPKNEALKKIIDRIEFYKQSKVYRNAQFDMDVLWRF